MYLSLDWLKDFVEIPKSITPEKLGEKLTMHTVEIDDVIKQAEKYKDVVVGKILEIKKHPNADRLQVAKVDVKSRELNIVCGAPNIQAGQLVPVAMVGAELPNGAKIEKAEVRGEMSEGMLCAEDELGLGGDHSGIMILEGVKIGQAFGDYLKFKDVLFEVDNKSITNRPDLWGHYGYAREISAFLRTNTTKKFTKIQNIKIKINKTEDNLKAAISDYNLCPRYMAVVMSGISIQDSPKWMQERLLAVGVRPINNIVDITNYVMLELGQPMHAFDRRQVDEILVRPAKKGEKITTLDDTERELSEEDLLITDGKQPIAIAGVMGGENSEVSGDTDTIVLESANFNPIAIRRTSQRLGLRTEASQRFEKSLDPNLCETAIKRAVELIKETCSKSQVISNLIDEGKFKLDQGPVEIELSWINKIIGVDIEKKFVLDILNKLGFSLEDKGDVISVAIPTWRATKDVSIKEDIAEEIVRIFGYENLDLKMPLLEMKAPKINEERKLERELKRILAYSAKLCEVYNYAFVGEGQLKKLGVDFSDYIKLANPITSQYTLLRQNLTPNLLNNIKTNQARHEEFGVFEIGSVFYAYEGKLAKNEKGQEKLPYQEKRLGIALAGKSADKTFNQLKIIIQSMFDNFALNIEYFMVERMPYWADAKRTALIKINNKQIGYIFNVDKQACQKSGIKKDVAIAELNFKDIFELVKSQGVKKFVEFPKYPPVIRDLAFVVGEKVLYNDIKAEILNHHEYLKDLELFDMYRGEKIGRDNKSLAFHLVYLANKTLTSQEVDEIQDSLIKKIEKRFDAKVRDF